jgi:HAE1 family hydrophobic/amphiphilic exporter-1
VGGQLANIYREGGKEYDITVRLQEKQRLSLNEVGDIKLDSPLGFKVPLRDVVTFQRGEGPLEIKRENSKRLVTVEANKTERPLGQIVTDIQASLREVDSIIPDGYSYEFGGETEDLRDAFIDLGLMFIAALILVYLILAALYESLIHPITIMIAVPLAFTGAVLLLYVTDTSFGVTAFIGMIMLVGIVATNSIVLIDFILEYHRQGMDTHRAIVEAGRTRLRPILMTAMTTLFGVVPIALGRAEGMELQQPLGIVIVGGLISSTFLTLLIIPVFYMIFDGMAEDLKNVMDNYISPRVIKAKNAFFNTIIFWREK